MNKQNPRVARWVQRVGVAGTVFISAGAFWLSFTALRHLAIMSGIETSQAWTWPLIVDGVIVVATVAVVAMGGKHGSWYPWLLLVAGALVSVTANAIQAGLSETVQVPHAMAAAVAAVPPIVLLAMTHLTVVLTRASTTEAEDTEEDDELEIPDFLIDRMRQNNAGSYADTEPTVDAAPEPQDDPDSPTEATRLVSFDEVAQEIAARRGMPHLGVEHARMARAQGESLASIAHRFGVHPTTVGRWLAKTEEGNEDA